MRLALLLAFATSVFAQSVEVGVAGGVPLTHAFTGYTLNPNGALGLCGECGIQHTLPYVVGPKVQIHLWRPLYFDAEALYSRADYTLVTSVCNAGCTVAFSDLQKHVVDRWEVPILLKMRLSSWHLVRPFVAAGVSLEHSIDSRVLVPIPGVVSWAIGPTFAAGASFGSSRVRPSIEVRYTRWTDQPIAAGNHSITLRSKQDDAQLLAGLTFGIGRSQPDVPGVLEGALPNRRVALGFKGGLPLTGTFSTRTNIGNTYPFNNCFDCGNARDLPYVFGPALEVRVIAGFSATAEAFYSRADYNHTSFISELSSGFLDSREKHTVNRWEAPLLLKYSLKIRRLTPFISAGASIEYDRDTKVRAVHAQYCFVCAGLLGLQPGVDKITLDTSSGSPVYSLAAGPTAGIGASFNVGRRVRPSIEVRYTHWADRAIAVYPPPPQAIFPTPIYPPTIASSRNQVQLLVGLMF